MNMNVLTLYIIYMYIIHFHLRVASPDTFKMAATSCVSVNNAISGFDLVGICSTSRGQNCAS